MILNNKLLDEITREAEKSPRLRMNYNLHNALDAKAQRLLNVLLPSTEIPIHRHNHTAETYIILRGKLIVFFHNEDGSKAESFLLNPKIGNYGLHIPACQWHSLEVIEPSTIFEVKDGPYTPLSPSDILTLL